MVTNLEAIELVGAARTGETADPASIEDAIAETEPPDYDEWVRAFREFQAGMKGRVEMKRITQATALVAAAGRGAAAEGAEAVPGVAPPPEDMDAPATGTLRVFAYGDTVPDEMLDPFREANPDVDLKVATFDSNKAAAAKLAGGFEADVVEVCTDEMEPLLARDLIRPLDPKAIDEFDKLAFSDADEVRNAAGEVLFVPASAGPHGLIVNTDELGSGDRLLPGALRPGQRRRSGARGDAADRDRRGGARDRPRRSDEPDRRGGGAGEAAPARQPRQLPRLRRVGLLHGQPVQVGRGRAGGRRPRDDRGDGRRRPSRSSGWLRRRARSRGSAASRSARRPRTSTPPTS